jgi:hypothetical protein
MRIRSFTLSMMQIRCKFLLLAAMAFIYAVPQGHAQTTNFLTQPFENPQFPPSGGWSDSSNQYLPLINPGYPYWYQNTSGNTSVTVNIPGNPPMGPYTASNITAHTGTGFAWFNSRLLDSGSVSELATPPLNFASLASVGGQYKLSFWVYMNSIASTDNNVIYVYYNATFPNTTSGSPVKIDSIYPLKGLYANGWKQYTYNLSQTYNTATGAYIIFKAIDRLPDAAATAMHFDMAMDDVRIDFTPPCTGKPGGTVNSIKPCKNIPFTLSYSDTVMTNLSYLWYSSSDSILYTSTGVTTPTLTQTITTQTTMYYRLVVRCGISNLTDTINLNAVVQPFYLCYCNDTNGNNHNANIGNVTLATYPSQIVLLNNGNANPIVNNSSATHSYSNYDYLTPALLYKDSLFGAYVTAISNTNSIPFGWYVTVFIDYDHSGTFDVGETAINRMIIGTSNPTALDTFRIKSSAQYGITGMRVVYESFSNSQTPCGLYSNGETEDYLVNIVHDQCNGKANAGKAYITDSAMCPGYTFTIGDSTHDASIFGIQYNFQSSPDNGVTFGNLPFVQNQDKLTITYVNPEAYRLQMVCLTSHDTSYSNIVKVVGEPFYACYCVSHAIGGVANDSTDIGEFRLGKFVYTKSIPNSVNSHLNNPSATHGRTDYTPYIMDLGIDSTYNFLLYQIMKGAYHGNGRITVLIDFNNNGKYDYPQDSVTTLYTTKDSFFVASTLTIQPHYYTVPNVRTGMRLVLNSDVSQNEAADNGCGSYISGETVDFVVRLHDSATAGITHVSNLSDFAIFPNPSSGRFKVMFDAACQVNHLGMTITNITGQQVMLKSYENVGTTFSENIDLGSQPRGIYFVEFMVDGERMVRKVVVE